MKKKKSFVISRVDQFIEIIIIILLVLKNKISFFFHFWRKKYKIKTKVYI